MLRGKQPQRGKWFPQGPTFATGASTRIQNVSDTHKHINEKDAAFPSEEVRRERRGGDQDGVGDKS